MRHRLFLALLLVAALFGGAPLFAQAPTKPLPAEADIKRAAAAVQEVYKEAYKSAKTNAAKVDLARRLLKDAEGTTDDLAARYVLLRTAKDMAAFGGDVTLAYAAIDQLTADFDLDRLALQAEVTVRVCAAVDTPLAYEAALRQCYLLSQAAALRDDYALADQLAAAAIAMAKRVKDPAAGKLWTARQKQLKEMATQFSKLAGALAVLKDQPADAAANLEVGKFRCLVQDDWKRGAPLLALGDDPLAKVAQQELEQRPALELGDAWWTLGDAQTGEAKRVLQRHAAEFYCQGIRELKGIARTKIQQRISEAAAVKVPLTERASGVAVIPVLDSATQAQNFSIGRAFDLSASWTLNGDFYAEAESSQGKILLCYADQRPGQDVFSVALHGNQIEVYWGDAATNQTEYFRRATIEPTLAGRWVNVKLRFDALARVMRLYIDDVLIEEKERTILPLPDKPMPLMVGGATTGPYQFDGKFRNVWLGNHD